MKKIKKPKDIKSLNKINEEWFVDEKEIVRIIRYNKVIGDSMWTKEQKADLDARSLKLNNKIDDVESHLNKKIDDVEVRLNKKIDDVEERLNKKIDSVEVRLNKKINDVEERLNKKIEANTQAILEVKKEVKKNSEGINKIISILNNKL